MRQWIITVGIICAIVGFIVGRQVRDSAILSHKMGHFYVMKDSDHAYWLVIDDRGNKIVSQCPKEGTALLRMQENYYRDPR